VLVRYYQELAHPASAVEAALAQDPQGWLAQLVDRSNERGMQLSAHVGLKIGPRRVQHAVTLSVSEPHHLGDTTVIPISWRPAGKTLMLPSLDGDLEVAAMGGDHSQLAISARYQPPLGWVGTVADRALMRRVAEATVKDFLDQVAQGVETIIAGRETPAAPG
jgi:hypothetical protein